MSLPRNNLRTLSAAHSRGMIDKSNYRRLRTAQLSAIEFNRKLPDLPKEMNDIVIPTKKIDEPHQPVQQQTSHTYIVWIIVAIAIITGGAYYALNFL